MPEALPGHAGWWRKNWKWAVPVLVLGFIATLVAFVFALSTSIFTGNDAYATAVARARASPIVIHELGEPIAVGWQFAGSVSINGPSGSADFSVPVKGPHGRGKLYVTATKSADRWTFTVLEVAIEGRDERVKLLGEGDGA